VAPCVVLCVCVCVCVCVVVWEGVRGVGGGGEGLCVWAEMGWVERGACVCVCLYGCTSTRPLPFPRSQPIPMHLQRLPFSFGLFCCFCLYLR
jgi:hypothetical protein